MDCGSGDLCGGGGAGRALAVAGWDQANKTAVVVSALATVGAAVWAGLRTGGRTRSDGVVVTDTDKATAGPGGRANTGLRGVGMRGLAEVGRTGEARAGRDGDANTGVEA